MPGARCTRSRAGGGGKRRVSHHGRTGITRHSRTRMVLTVYFVLSLVTGLSCHHRPQEALLLENLTPASGVRTTRLLRPQGNALVSSAAYVHRIPCPTFVTIAKRPSVWAGMAEDREVICAKWKQKYFCEGGWTGKSANDPSGKSVDGRCSRLQRSGGFQHFPVTKSGSRASLLFF